MVICLHGELREACSICNTVPRPLPGTHRCNHGQLEGTGPCTFCMVEADRSAVGRKNDKGKPRWSLLPLKSVELVIGVLEFGAAIYGAHNWRNVEDADTRYYDAFMRHVTKHRNGEFLDPESGLPHLAHAICSLLFSLELKL